MRKKILAILAVLVFSMSVVCVDAKTAATPAVNSAIKMYKAKNYSQCYASLKQVVAKDPSNALAYYYLAMASAQIGNKEEAIANYERVLSLSPKGQLQKYAQKGKICLEQPDQCNAEPADITPLDKFIKDSYGSGLSPQVRSEYEQQKIENLMREMNRGGNVDPAQFKEYKDFSSSAVPTNDEIVAALRVLQRAGFGNLLNTETTDLSLLTGDYNKNNNAALLNMLNGGSANLSPQVIQSLLTNQMSIGF